MPGSKTACRPFPRSLAMYIAASASRSRSSALAASLDAKAMPRLGVSCSSWPADLDRAADRLDGAIRDVSTCELVGEALQQQRELVAAQPCRAVRRARRAVEPRRDLAQDGVARRVPERVVHGLEVVEVEEDDGAAGAMAPAPAQRLDDPVLEQRAVRQAGQGVVERLVLEPALERRALAHVARVRGRLPPRSRRPGGSWPASPCRATCRRRGRTRNTDAAGAARRQRARGSARTAARSSGCTSSASAAPVSSPRIAAEEARRPTGSGR